MWAMSGEITLNTQVNINNWSIIADSAVQTATEALKKSAFDKKVDSLAVATFAAAIFTAMANRPNLDSKVEP